MRNIVLFLLPLVISACSSKGTDSGISDDQIVPVAVGNSWSFIELPIGGFNSDTNVYTLTITKDTMMTLTIDGVINIGRWYRVEGFVGGPPTYYADRADGNWMTFFINDGQNDIPVTALVAKYPATIGDTYTRLYPPPINTGSQNVEVISTGTSVSVAAGTFTCLGYRVTLISDGRRQADIYYSPGVGLVKINHYDLAPGNNSVTRETRLTGYNIN